MPRLELTQPYKSLQTFEPVVLPRFTVVTGVNGSGKTQLLEAIKQGYIKAEGVEQKYITLQYWHDLRSHRVSSQAPKQVSLMRYDSIKEFHRAAQAGISAFRTSLQKASIGWVDVDDPRDLALVMSNGEELYKRMKRVHSIVEEDPGHPEWSAFVQARNKLVNHYNQNVFGAGGLHPLLKPAAERYEKHPISFTLEELEMIVPLGWEQYTPFQHDLSRVFGAYYAAWDENRYDCYRNKERNEANKCLSDEEFISRYGRPPWELFNELLCSAKLEYIVDPPSERPDANYSPVLRHKLTGTQIDFGSLSTGEHVLLSFVFCMFNETQEGPKVVYPSLLLLDEVDAPLHPQMTKRMLDIIHRVLVMGKGVPVILTTHSPSTVALCPVEALHIMESHPHRLVRCSRERAVWSLSSGYVAVMPGSRFVLAEAASDREYYTAIVSTLVEKRELPAYPSLVFIQATDKQNRNGGGKTQVQEWGTKLTEAGLSNIYGIIDRDQGNVPTGNIKVLPRYSIENYWIDPIILYAVLMKDGKHTRLHDAGIPDQNFYKLDELAGAELQAIVSAVCAKIEDRNASLRNEMPPRRITYINGKAVEVPDWLYTARGKDLIVAVLNTFQHVVGKGYHITAHDAEACREMLLEKLTGFIPRDLVKVLAEVQAAGQ